VPQGDQHGGPGEWLDGTQVVLPLELHLLARMTWDGGVEDDDDAGGECVLPPGMDDEDGQRGDFAASAASPARRHQRKQAR